jgi:putative ABC transport system permease protein
VKLRGDAASVQGMITLMEQKWAQFFSGNPFEYFFLDDHFAAQYKADEQFGQTFALFAVLAIIVACLGLYGLASFVTTQRTKEIGIRKISGAGVSSLLLLLTKDFLKPILISFAIAIPVTAYLLSQWLQNYAFKTTLSVWFFILPALLILFIAVVTIITKTFQAATANPVKNLRTE